MASTRVEFQHFMHVMLHIVTNILVKKLFGNHFVGRSSHVSITIPGYLETSPDRVNRHHCKFHCCLIKYPSYTHGPLVGQSTLISSRHVMLARFIYKLVTRVR